MALKSPEQELEEFVSTLPKWIRKYLEGEPWNEEDRQEIGPDLWLQLEKATPLYEQLIRKIPSKFRKYKKRQAAFVNQYVIAGKPGRPPKAEETERILRLRQEGKSQGEIAKALGHKDIVHAKDRVRKRLKAYGKPAGKNPH